MKRIDTAIPGAFVIEPSVFGDARGYFFESYHQEKFATFGITKAFVQDNQSHSRRGVLRGLHYQLGRPQAKLVRALAGEIFDVAVDVRKGSPTFGNWVGERLSSDNKRMLYVPEGFAHGFLVLSEVAEILYKCTDLYTPTEERGILWNSPELGIPWPLASGIEPILSSRDILYPTLASAPTSDLPECSP